MDRQLIKHVLGRTDFDATVTVAGWVRTRRDSKGGFSFIEVNDGSAFSGIQVVAPGELPNYESDILKITIGSSISVTGRLVESPGQGQSVEIHASEITVFGFADTEMTKVSAETVAKRTGKPAEEILASYAATNAHGRLLSPDSIAKRVVWFCLPDQAGVTGEAVEVNGSEKG